MKLTDQINKKSQTLSGGNKRKLSTIMALIGSNDIIFLDERILFYIHIIFFIL